MRRTRLIVNPSAGAGRAARRAAAVRPRLEEILGPLDWVETACAEEVTAAARDAAARGAPQVLVAGGDGTVHFAANGVAGSETALGILPVGTGNDVAEAIGVPRDLERALDVLRAGQARRIDVGSAGGRVFVCVLGVGMDTDALRAIEGAWLLRRGRLLYTLAALRTLLFYRPRRLSIAWGDGPAARFEGRVVFGAVTNTKTYAGGMRIAPHADIADGRLDVCIVREMSLPRLLARFASVVAGKHEGRAGVVLAQGERVRLESEEPLPITLDGELTPLRTPLEVRVLPGALRVLAAPVAGPGARVREEAARAA